MRSYDVFDTVVTRLVGLPSSAFLLLGHALVAKGIWPHTATQFSAARVDAENRARANTSRRDITLPAIYAELAFALPLTPEQLSAAADEELRLERCLLRAVPGAAAQLALERAKGHEIAFISDMYLSEAQIGGVLHDLGLRQADERLWVSSESGQTKSDGTLFDLVAKERPTAPADWVHTGDNAWSDIRMAQSRGIQAIATPACHLTGLELAMERHGPSSNGLGSLLAGAARWTRLSTGSEATEDQRVLADYASQIAGPAVYAFVLWVLRCAQREGIRRVWFMARDGEVMLPIARAIARRLQIDVDIGYLFGGRQVVKVAALRSIDEASIKWLCGGSGILTLAEVLTRVGVDSAEFHEVAAECGLPTEGEIGWDRMGHLATFLRDPRVASRVLASAAERRTDVLDYFRQCSLTGGERCCVVDIGWRGTVVKAIDELIGRDQAAPHLYLYFGLYAKPPECAGLRMKGYLFEEDQGVRHGSGLSIETLTAVMETFCQADHGPVMRLERTGDSFRPVCKPETPAAGSRWDVRFFQQQLVTFGESVAIELCPAGDVDLRGLVSELLLHGLQRPSLAQARVLGSVQFVDDQAGSAAQPLAHAYGWADLRTAFNQKSLPWYGLNWWTAGAWALTSPSMRVAIRLAARLGRLRRSAA